MNSTTKINAYRYSGYTRPCFAVLLALASVYGKADLRASDGSQEAAGLSKAGKSRALRLPGLVRRVGASSVELTPDGWKVVNYATGMLDLATDVSLEDWLRAAWMADFTRTHRPNCIGGLARRRATRKAA